MWEAFRKDWLNWFIQISHSYLFYPAHYDLVKKSELLESESPGFDSQLSLLNCVTLKFNLISLGPSFFLHNLRAILSSAKFTESLEETNEMCMKMLCS